MNLMTLMCLNPLFTKNDLRKPPGKVKRVLEQAGLDHEHAGLGLKLDLT